MSGTHFKLKLSSVANRSCIISRFIGAYGKYFELEIENISDEYIQNKEMILFENTGHDKKIEVNSFDLITPKGNLKSYELKYGERTIYYSDYNSALNMRKECIDDLEKKPYIFAVESEDDQGGFQILDTLEIKEFSEWKSMDEDSFIQCFDYYITEIPFDYLNEIFYENTVDFNFLDDDELSKLGLVCIFEHFNVEDNSCVDMDLEERLIKRFFES